MACIYLYILSTLAVAVSLLAVLIAGKERKNPLGTKDGEETSIHLVEADTWRDNPTGTYYADLEHLNITYWNTKYYGFMNYSALRHSRRDPMHYVNFHYETLVSLGNNVTVDVHIYEFLSNEYRPSFVEMHYQLCDLLFKDKIFGSLLYERMPLMYKRCPFPKGEYRVENISFPDVPVFSTFPFQKGRVFVNFSCPKLRERMVEGYIDLIIKSRWR